MTAVRRRLDSELVRRRMAPSRAAAQALITNGRVRVSGAVAHKPSRMVAASEPVLLSGDGARFVSRGGDKLEAALQRFGIEVAGKRALDAGSSTGGFVDCLLKRGAAEVVAVDVGWGQLDAGLRSDSRVTVRERCNVRHIMSGDIGGPADIVTADLSFISLRTVMANLAECTIVGGEAVLLIKPQFEAGRREASRGKGVVRDLGIWRRVIGEVAASAVEHGLSPANVAASTLRGAAGNAEFFLHCRRVAPHQRDLGVTADGIADFDLDTATDAAIRQVHPAAVASGAAS